MGSENQFCTLLLSVLLRVIKYTKTRSKPFKRTYKSVLSHITFYLEDDDHKSVQFNGEAIGFTCQLIKI